MVRIRPPLPKSAPWSPAGRWFESDRRYQNRPHGQAVKTSPFHGGNPSSSLGGVTTITQPLRGAVVFVLGALPALGLRSFGRTAGSRTRPPTRVGEDGDLAQLVRALALQARGQRFKSASLHHTAARHHEQHPAKICGVSAYMPAAVSTRRKNTDVRPAPRFSALRRNYRVAL